ncbi:MAG: RNA polymerase sigma factor, partial [Deltaproteobacteria bacterium]
MSDTSEGALSPALQPERFATTRWSLVVAAAGNESGAARGALETLCTVYWYPLYAFVRRRGYAAAQAEDLTQGFFAMLLERGDLVKARPERGRFRSFLLTALKHFLLNEREREQALKRGGSRAPLSFDFPFAEGRFSREPSADTTPEDVFEKQWALTLLEQIQRQLRDEYTAAGKGALFDRL